MEAIAEAIALRVEAIAIRCKEHLVIQFEILSGSGLDQAVWQRQLEHGPAGRLDARLKKGMAHILLLTRTLRCLCYGMDLFRGDAGIVKLSAVARVDSSLCIFLRYPDLQCPGRLLI